MSASVAATTDLYPDAGAVRDAAVATNAQTPSVLLYGRIHDESSLGALGTWKLLGLGGVAVALLAMVVVRRHTRADEEAGRLELLSAGVLGSRAALAAALISGSAAVLLTSLLTVLATGAGGAAVGRVAGVRRRVGGARSRLRRRHGPDRPTHRRAPVPAPGSSARSLRRRMSSAASPTPPTAARPRPSRGSRRWAGPCRSARRMPVTGGCSCSRSWRRVCSPVSRSSASRIGATSARN